MNYGYNANHLPVNNVNRIFVFIKHKTNKLVKSWSITQRFGKYTNLSFAPQIYYNVSVQVSTAFNLAKFHAKRSIISPCLILILFIFLSKYWRTLTTQSIQLYSTSLIIKDPSTNKPQASSRGETIHHSKPIIAVHL